MAASRRFGMVLPVVYSYSYKNALRRLYNVRLCSSKAARRPLWQLASGVCIERKPIVTQPQIQLEQTFLELMEKVELEKSLKSDHEMRHEADVVRFEQLKTGKLEESELDAVVMQTARDFEDAGVDELHQFKPANLVTEGDTKGDVRCPNRCLDKYLYLIVKQKLGKNNTWVLPQAFLQEGESLRQTAERAIRETCGDKINAQFLGNAPVGFYKYKFPHHMRGEEKPIGAKVFFFKAQYKGGDIEYIKEVIDDYQWATNQQLQEFLRQSYYQEVSQFLIDEKSADTLRQQEPVEGKVEQYKEDEDSTRKRVSA